MTLPNLPRINKLTAQVIGGLVAICLLVVAGHTYLDVSTKAYGAQLGNRVLQLSDNEISAVSTYQVAFDLSTPGTIGSVEIQFCSNDPFPQDPCTVPAGLNISAATLGDQSGPGDFSIAASSTANEFILSRPASSLALQTLRFAFPGVVNPSSAGSYYVRLQTFASTDASGPASDYGGIAFAIANGISISAEVPPYLTFCTGVTITGLNCANAVGDYIDFGELSASHVSDGSSQMLVATNAGSGFTISDNGTSLSSGANVINALATNDVSRPGTSQFGLNLTTNTVPGDGADPVGPGQSELEPNYDLANSYRFDSGDTLVADTVPDDVKQYTISYIVNVPASQAPGIYVSTITYICLADF